MFPFFEVYDWIFIYTFWLTLSICFFLFLWMLKKLSFKYSYDFSFFTKNMIWYFLSIFFFSRLFYIISRWNDLSYIREPFQFFITSDYNFSLLWAIFWFFLVLFIKIKLRKESFIKYIDWIVLSFLFVLFMWYIWSLFGGQVYGKETLIWIEILYTHPFTKVPYEVAIFPLPIVYSIVFFIEFSMLYILSIYVNTRWLIGYLWIISFSSILLILEFFSWKYDILKDNLNFNFNQLLSIIIIIVSFYSLYKLIKLSDIKNLEIVETKTKKLNLKS